MFLLSLCTNISERTLCSNILERNCTTYVKEKEFSLIILWKEWHSLVDKGQQLVTTQLFQMKQSMWTLHYLTEIWENRHRHREQCALRDLLAAELSENGFVRPGYSNYSREG